MYYLLLALILGMGNPIGTGTGNGPIVIQTADDDSGDQGEEGDIIPPTPPRPPKPTKP